MSDTNKELVDRYRNDKVIIKTYYTDQNGVNVDGIVNPLKIDNRQYVAPTDDQTRYPACAGYSACTVIESLLWKHTGRLVQLDSRQVYAKAKELDGDIDVEGTCLETALSAAMQLCSFDFMRDARIELFPNSKDLDTIERVKFILHKYGLFQAGFQIDEAWYTCSSQDYVIKSGGRPLGGHAVVVCGADWNGAYISNSWGKSWGAKGFGVLPWDLFLKEFMYGAFISGITY